jgi:hypothetical protein
VSKKESHAVCGIRKLLKIVPMERPISFEQFLF